MESLYIIFCTLQAPSPPPPPPPPSAAPTSITSVIQQAPPKSQTTATAPVETRPSTAPSSLPPPPLIDTTQLSLLQPQLAALAQQTVPGSAAASTSVATPSASSVYSLAGAMAAGVQPIMVCQHHCLLTYTCLLTPYSGFKSCCSRVAVTAKRLGNDYLHDAISTYCATASSFSSTSSTAATFAATATTKQSKCKLLFLSINFCLFFVCRMLLVVKMLNNRMGLLRLLLLHFLLLLNACN